MTRVIARPEALLDGAPVATDMLPPGSDAHRYSEGSRPFSTSFREVLPYRLSPSAEDAEKMKEAGVPCIDGRFLFWITGEDGARYAFDRIDSAEGDEAIAEGPLRVLRFFGKDYETAQVLGFVGLDSSGEPLFYDLDIEDRATPGAVIDDLAKQHELMQIVNAGADASEWSMH